MGVYFIDLKVRYKKNPDDLIEQMCENWGMEVIASNSYEDPDFEEEN